MPSLMKRVLFRSAVATAAVIAVNVVLFVAGGTFGASYVVPDDMAGVETTTLGLFEIVLGTVVPMVLGTALWLGLRRFARGRLVLGLLVGLTVASSLVPFAGDWQSTSKIFLGLMHFTTPLAFLFATKPSSRKCEASG